MKKYLCAGLLAGLLLPAAAFAAEGMPPNHAEEAAKRADDRFDGMDADKDGMVIYEEFLKRFPQMSRQAFDAIDTDKDGRISRVEWRNFFLNHGMGGSGMGGGMGGMPPGHGGMEQKGGQPMIRPPDAK